MQQIFTAIKMCIFCPFYTPFFCIKGLVVTYPDVSLPVIGTNEKVGSVSSIFLPHEKDIS